jgi:broad specificity phosphatase PhoE
MILYLIRHGRTDAYLENKRQSPRTSLGELGKKQTQALVDNMHLSKVDHLYSSDWPRARETAEYISKSLGQDIKIHPLVYEIQKHPDLDEVADESEINLRYMKESRENTGNLDWKFDGKGESLNEVIDRARKVISFLVKEHADETVAIVSHGIFLTIMTSLILLGFDYEKDSLLKLSWSLKIHNTGVSTFRFNPETKHLTMICFNDHAHLEKENLA